MDLTSVMQWATSDSGIATLSSSVLGVMTVAQVVVNLTPTPKDNEIYGKVYKWVERVAGIWSIKAKLLPGETIPDVAPTAVK